MHCNPFLLICEPRRPRLLQCRKHRQLVWAHCQILRQVRLRAMTIKTTVYAIQGRDAVEVVLWHISLHLELPHQKALFLHRGKSASCQEPEHWSER
jgi:hypothetical protein